MELEGEKIYPFIEKTVNQYFMVIEKAKEICELETGIVRMGTLASISAHWIPELLKGFQNLYPKVTFVIHQGDYTSMQEWIKTGAIDFGFVNPNAVNSLEIMELKRGEMLAILPENHPLSKEKLIPLDRLAEEPFIEHLQLDIKMKKVYPLPVENLLNI